MPQSNLHISRSCRLSDAREISYCVNLGYTLRTYGHFSSHRPTRFITY